MTGQLAQMNLHVRRKLSELFLQHVRGSRERETDMETGEGDGWKEKERERRREDSVLTSLNERKLSVSARSKIN